MFELRGSETPLPSRKFEPWVSSMFEPGVWGTLCCGSANLKESSWNLSMQRRCLVELNSELLELELNLPLQCNARKWYFCFPSFLYVDADVY